MNPSEETDRLAKDASLPIIADNLTQTVNHLGKIINNFEKFLNETNPDISIKHKEEKSNVSKQAT